MFFYWNNVNFKGNKLPFKQSYDKQNLKLMVISYEIDEMSLKAHFINFIWNAHSCKILYVSVNTHLIGFYGYL